MNGNEVLRIVDAIHRDKSIEKEIVFEGISQAILSAARKHFGEESEIEVDIDRETGEPSARVDGAPLNPDEIGELLGRIAAQTAKQVMIQKIREAERDSLFDEFSEMRGQLVTGSISRMDGGTATVNLGKVEAILPRGEQIPGESHRSGERIRAIVMEVRKVGSRVRIILSRTHPELVRRLFETEIPEVAERIIEVRSLAREAGYRSKVAVSCYDSKIDCVGACVGVRGARIRGIVDELAGERIDIVRWNDSLQVLVPNALQPAEVEDVILCPMLGKVIVLVHEDQLSLAIGKKGQNVRLASKLVGWDIHVMTQDKLDEQLGSSVTAFSAVPGVSEELAESLVEQGFFTFDDLSVIEPDQLAELGGLSADEVEKIVAYADEESIRIEAEERRLHEQERLLRRQAAARAELEEAEEGVAEEAEEPAAEEAEQPEAEVPAAELLEEEAPETAAVLGEETQAEPPPEAEPAPAVPSAEEAAVAVETSAVDTEVSPATEPTAVEAAQIAVSAEAGDGEPVEQEASGEDEENRQQPAPQEKHPPAGETEPVQDREESAEESLENEELSRAEASATEE